MMTPGRRGVQALRDDPGQLAGDQGELLRPTSHGAAAPAHVHDSFRCPEHVYGCPCPDLDEWLCNPYWVRDHCPDELLVMPDDPRYEATAVKP